MSGYRVDAIDCVRFVFAMEWIPMSKFLPYLLMIGFLLLIFATRIFAIDHFPVFLDETIHIYSAEKLSDISPLYNVGIGRVLTIWWFWLFQATQSDPIWIARVATIIIILPGITALLQLAYRISGYTALIMMGLFLLFSPYHYFFERLALADPIAASFVLVSICLGYRLSARFNYQDAILCGGFLALSILAKSNAIPYAGVALAAAVGFSYRHQFKSLAKWFSIAMMSLLIPVVAFEILVRLTGNAWLAAIYSYVASRSSTSSVSIVERISGNVLETIIWFSAYMHPVMAVILLLAFVLTILRRRFYLLLVFLAPLFPMWIGEPQETRYWLVPIGLAGLLLAIEISQTLQKFSWKIKLIPIAGLLVWGSLLWLPQMMTTANNPLMLNLPETDKRQYIYSDATGFGFEQVPEMIPDVNRPQIIGLLANCQGLRFTYWNTYEILCRSINSNGSDIPALIAWVDENRGLVPYVILEDSSYIPDTIDGEVIRIIERPDNRANLTIIDIRG